MNKHERIKKLIHESLFNKEDLQPKSAVAIILNGNKILLGTSLSDDDRYGKLCFPGGGIESGETVFQAARREAQEETGVTSSCFQANPIFYKEEPRVVFVTCKYETGEPKPNHEFSDLNWYDLNNLPTDKVYEKNLRILHRLRKPE